MPRPCCRNPLGPIGPATSSNDHGNDWYEFDVGVHHVGGDRIDELWEQLDTRHLPEDDVPFAHVALASRKDPGNPELCPP